MTFALLAALVVVVLAFLVFTARDREATARVLAQLSKDAHDREQALLQRIQAPQAAVTQYHYADEPVTPPAVRSDDEPGADEDWMTARLSREDLARLEGERELTGG